jgi:NitT/TauT family transport system ATP-binding protein
MQPTTTTPPTGPGVGGGTETILEVSHLTKQFKSPDGTPRTVLDDISFSLKKGEIVVLLGQSGAGKSTLLRCVAGLITPTSGTVTQNGAPVTGPNPGVALVFQSFALLPWLTVLKNVEIGLQAKGLPPAQCADRATREIDRIGLDGFESAYPRELSGGMQQRVGFARALVVEPDALLLDEAFSALDVLTAENLRNELLELWASPDFPTEAMLIVTHNIEEAVILADRIFVLGSNPGRIRTELSNTLPRPRVRQDPDCQALINHIYGIMEGHDQAAPGAKGGPAAEASPVQEPMPAATVGGMAGLLEILAAHGGQSELPALARRLTFDTQDLIPLVEAAEMLGLATVHGTSIELTKLGHDYVAGDIDTRKSIVARQARADVPLIRVICNSLESAENRTLDQGFFLDLLRHGFSDQQARQQLDLAIAWGRYAELYEYDADTGDLKLDHPPAGNAAAGHTAGGNATGGEPSG